MPHQTPLPGDRAPALDAKTFDGRAIDLANDKPENFSLIFFYRGVHCPICRTQLEELDKRVGDFEAAGIKVHAVSMDEHARAERQKNEWDIANLSIGYALSENSARSWGLFISGKEQDAEPERFAEPGIAAIYPDGRIYALWLQSVPIARPTVDGLLKGLQFVTQKNYPVRGKLAA